MFQQGVQAGAGAAVQGLNTPSAERGLLAGARTLGDQGAGLTAGGQRLATGAAGLSAGVEKLDTGARQLAGGAKDLSGGASQLADGLDQLADGTDRLADGLRPLATGIRSSADGAAKLATGASELSSGTQELADGTGQSADGARELSDGLIKLSDGGGKLADGSAKLADGLAKGADAGADLRREHPDQAGRGGGHSGHRRAARRRCSPTSPTPRSWPPSPCGSAGWPASWCCGPCPSRALTSMKPSWRLAVEALLPAAGIAAVQAVALTAVLQVLLELNAGQVAQLLPFLLLAGRRLRGRQPGPGRLARRGGAVRLGGPGGAGGRGARSPLPFPELLRCVTPLPAADPGAGGSPRHRERRHRRPRRRRSADRPGSWLGLAAAVLAVARRRMLPAVATVKAT